MREGDNRNKYFPRSRGIIQENGFKVILVSASAFSIVYLIKSLLSFLIPVSSSVLYLAIFIVIGGIGYYYNSISQAKNKDIKNALLLDWYDLPYKIHILIIVLTCLFVLVKIIIAIYNIIFPKQPPRNNGIIKLIRNNTYEN